MRPTRSTGSGGDGDDAGEGPPVEVNFLIGRFRSVGAEPGERCPCKKQSERSAGERQDQRFGEVLTDKTPAGTAKCSANGEISLPSGRAGNEKVGHVQTGDEQQAERRRKQSVERCLEVLDCGIG